MSDKLFYRIGEACKRLDIQPYVLRYWETEFPFLIPSKSKSGQRVYGEAELDIIRRIKELLYEEGYTIAGAKKKLESELSSGKVGSSNSSEEPPKQQKKRKKKKGQRKEASASDPAADSEEVARLRKGIEVALTRSRKILDLLSS